jgi:lysophospholipase L1-like esterase
MSGASPSAPAPTMLVIGDSVVWGQGLLERDKFSSKVLSALQQNVPNLTIQGHAHSGASVVTEDDSSDVPAPGEVPRTKPTILAQCNAFTGDPDSVQAVLLDGGINDVRLDRILSPFTTQKQLDNLIEQCCYIDMTKLLIQVATKFSSPDCRIMVVAYYPILSNDSEMSWIPQLLTVLGHDVAKEVSFRAQGLPLSNPVDLALRFWTQSDAALQAAVDEVNANVGANRITFVSPGYGPQNSLFAQDPWLWELELDLSATDPVRDAREQACKQIDLDFPDCVICPRASVGHPNVTGAQKYADAILRALA